MPDCACYDGFRLEPDSRSSCTLRLRVGGRQRLLQKTLQASGLAENVALRQSVRADVDWSWVTYTLSGIRDESPLRDFLSMLRRRIVIDLSPILDACYALGPYSLGTDAVGWGSSQYEELIRKAKYGEEFGASARLIREVLQFVWSHPQLHSIATVAPPPVSENVGRNLPWDIAQLVAERLGIGTVDVLKVVLTEPQKNRVPEETEETMIARVANTMCVAGLVNGEVLIVDDALGSGGTMKETARALRQAGANRVYGLCVAKDHSFIEGGLSLSPRYWL